MAPGPDPRRVVGAVQHYDWGDRDFIPDLLGRPRDGRPWAELWFGTHHGAPATLDAPDGPPLSSVAGEMSMLVKILACSSPLSLQTHPTADQARDGFAREERNGPGPNDPRRLYRDDSDKPEMIVALTPFEALCGVAPLAQSRELLDAMDWTTESAVLDQEGVSGYLAWAFAQPGPPSLAHAPEWLQRVGALHPRDPGLRVAALLNHVHLSPGEALALPAGNLHAYLRGAGLEVMKSSDNVVRAGFTSKHVDVDELLAIVDPTPLIDPLARPIVDGPWLRYPSPTAAFDVGSWSWTTGDMLGTSDRVRLVLGGTGLFPGQRSFETVLLMPGDTLVASAPPGPSGTGSWWVCTQG